MLKIWTKRPLYVQIFVCLIIGVLIGVFAKPIVPYTHPLGVIFLRLLKMLIVPLSFFTLISGVISMGDVKSLRQIGLKILFLFAIMTIIAASVGCGAGLIFNIGEEVHGTMSSHVVSENAGKLDLVANIINWFPVNIVDAMATENMLQIIFFALFMGSVLLVLGEEKAGAVIKFIKQSGDVMISMTEYVMKTAPYGILALVADMTSTLGSKMLVEVGKFIVVEYMCLFLVLVVGYPLMIRFLAGLNPLRFFRNVFPAMIVAASTTSSAATLPVSMKCSEENLGLPEKIYGFALPLGATINMNGVAVYYALLGVFASHLYDIPITIVSLVQFVFLGLILAMGSAAVKGGAIVGSTILLTTLGMPLTIMPIVAAINPIIDIGHTTLNSTGDMVAATVVAARSDMIDIDVYEGRKNAETI